MFKNNEFFKNEKISSDMIIAADGKNSAVRKILGTNALKILQRKSASNKFFS